MTELDEGITVFISQSELDRLKKRKGFLEIENYPDFWKYTLKENEVGRFLIFRFIMINN